MFHPGSEILRVGLEFDSPITVYKVLTVILGLKTPGLTVLVGGKIVNSGYALQDGDEVHIYPPIARRIDRIIVPCPIEIFKKSN